MRKKVGLIAMVILFVCLLEPQAGQHTFGDIPGGDFSSVLFSNDVPSQQFFGQGFWNFSVSPSTATAIITGNGADRHMELDTAWYPRAASGYFVSELASLGDESWIVSADLKAEVEGNGKADRIFAIGTSISDLSFSLNFMYSARGDDAVIWQAGSMSGTNDTLTASIRDAYETVSIQYNGITGSAKALLGNEVIFDVTTETGLAGMDIVFFRKYDRGTFDRGAFRVDNVTAAPGSAAD